jgi:hypothetical protein
MPREPRSTSASLNLIQECSERLENVEYQYIPNAEIDVLASRLETLTNAAEADQTTQDEDDAFDDEEEA